MIFGGTALQTVILGVVTALCDWDKEVKDQIIFFIDLIYAILVCTNLIMTKYFSCTM